MPTASNLETGVRAVVSILASHYGFDVSAAEAILSGKLNTKLGECALTKTSKISPPKIRSTTGGSVPKEAWQKVIENWECPLSQGQYYRALGADPDTVKVASLEGKKYGSKIEEIIRGLFRMRKGTDTGHDGQIITDDCKVIRVEMKATRYYANGHGPGKLQHIQATHDYELLLGILLEVDGSLNLIAMAKQDALTLGLGDINSTANFTKQGKKDHDSDQGWWIDFCTAEKIFTKIRTREDLIDVYTDSATRRLASST
jgi:hypothetical protein